ncbi:MAG: hypothetical protein CSA62_11985 [Planctomycetota bacterium]|nr:MAG: hypothetical protein CSA62_11985 [Planctomycetota bacterium]
MKEQEPEASASDAKPARWQQSYYPAPLARFEAVLLVLSSLAILGFFAWILVATEPDRRGHGTHEQLGMQPCAWPILYGEPCPTCGVTTSVSWLAHGRPDMSLWTQPFGFTLGLAALLWVLLSLRSLVRGESLLFRVSQWPLLWITLGAGAIFLLGWGWVHWTWESPLR